MPGTTANFTSRLRRRIYFRRLITASMRHTKTLALLDALILEVEKPSLPQPHPPSLLPLRRPRQHHPAGSDRANLCKARRCQGQGRGKRRSHAQGSGGRKDGRWRDGAAAEALYQGDTYLFTNEGERSRHRATIRDTGWVVFLDRTCFHPQGGGQPSDTGTITSIEGGEPFAVAMQEEGSGRRRASRGLRRHLASTVGARSAASSTATRACAMRVFTARAI